MTQNKAIMFSLILAILSLLGMVYYSAPIDQAVSLRVCGIDYNGNNDRFCITSVEWE